MAAGQLGFQSAGAGRPTYPINSSNQAPSAAADLAVAEVGPAKDLTVDKIVITNPGLQTTAGVVKLQLLRTAVGTGGAVIPNPVDQQDGPFSGIARVGPSPIGVAGEVLLEIGIFVPAAVGAFTPIVLDLQTLIGKAPRIKAGQPNGIALRHPGAAGATGFYANLIVSEQREQ